MFIVVDSVVLSCLQVLLHSSKGDSGFTDRSLLKNLGHWLGLLTLARSIPILHKVLDLSVCIRGCVIGFG